MSKSRKPLSKPALHTPAPPPPPPTPEEARAELAGIYRAAAARRVLLSEMGDDARLDIRNTHSRDLMHVLAATEANIIAAAVGLGLLRPV